MAITGPMTSQKSGVTNPTPTRISGPMTGNPAFNPKPTTTVPTIVPTAPAPAQNPNVDNLGLPKATISSTPPDTRNVFQKIGDWFNTTFGPSKETQVALAQNAYALQKVVPEAKDVPLTALAQPGGNVLKNSPAEQITKDIGLRGVPTTSELSNTIITIGLAEAFIAAPLGTLFTVGAATAFNKVKSNIIAKVKGKPLSINNDQTLSDLTPNASPAVKNTLDLIDFMGTVAILSFGVNKALKSKNVAGKVELTPDQARETVSKRNLDKTDLGKTVIDAAKDAEAQGKNLEITMEAQSKSVVAKATKANAPEGLQMGINLVEPSTTIGAGVTAEAPMTVYKAVPSADKALTITTYDDAGAGVYFGMDKSVADSYAGEVKRGEPQKPVVSLNVNDAKLLDTRVGSNDKIYQDIASSVPKNLTNENKAAAISSALAQKGYDGVILSGKRSGEGFVVPTSVDKLQVQPTAPKQPITGPMTKAPETTMTTPTEVSFKTVDRTQIDNTKTIQDVKTSLKNIRTEIDNLTTEAQGKSTLAQEQREGLNVENITSLKRVYRLNPKFQEGDIETMRHNSKIGPLVNKVIENVQEKYPYLSEQEAFDYAIELPNKGEEAIKLPSNIKSLKARSKTLKSYLDLLNKKQIEFKSNEAYKEWSDALSEQHKLEKILEVPRRQIPVGEGDVKVSRLEARVKKALDNISQETIDKLGLTTYQQMNNKDMIARASEYVINHPEEALQVLSGDVQVPKGLNTGAIYVAMVNNAVGNVDLANKLATLSSTAMGQNIEILKEIDPNSPVKVTSEIIKVREKALERKYAKKSVTEIKKAQVAKGEKMIKPPTAFDWAAIIKEVRCT